ncbi:MAG: hypothetical protein NTZ25_02570 [Candidatus Peregrinibacteria bacterium]|nr:hypothetical protein [Candidatus Peregrinibacteria bacterium]
MISNKKVLLLLTTVLLSSFLNFPQTTFAEGVKADSTPDACSGRVTGTTKAYNPNSGVISFDAHSGPGAEDNLAVNLGVAAAGAVGLAPANRSDAACVSKVAGVDANTGKAYAYAVKGWAWDTNAGFVSFNCQNGSNNAGGANVACGNINYGVYIAADNSLLGYAWNPTLGWIRFDDNNKNDAYVYGVKIDPVTFVATGYAWTSAGVYVDLTGVTFNLPDKDNVVVVDTWCKNKPYLCVEITPDPSSLSFNSAPAVAVADGKDGYYLNMYFRNASGVSVSPLAITNLANVKLFDWTDTVKLNQIDPLNVNANAVLNKPLYFSDFKLASDGDIGHYISKNKIVSYAPTSESKLSLTTGTKPAYLTNNENFIYTPDGIVGGLPKPNTNQLILNNISWPQDLVDGVGNVVIPATSSPIYPNGKVGLPFKFRPAVYLDTLYANDFQDNILGYRSVPVTIKRSLKTIGNLNAITGNAEYHVAFSSSQTGTQCSGQDVNFQFTVKDDAAAGSVITNNTSGDVTINALANKINPDISTLIGKIFDLQFTPDIPTNPQGTLPCDMAKGATFYSKISYTVDGKTVSYYDNKLPRTGGDSIVNPAVVVHGNITAQAVGNVQGDNRVTAAGSVNVALIRDAINENLQRNGGSSIGAKSYSDCSITSMNDNAGKGTMGLGDATVCPSGSSSYYRFDVGSEHVLYTKANLTLSFGAGNWTGKWIVIADGGNIFVDKNILPSDPVASRISLVAFRSSDAAKYYQTGNIYIAPTVTNIVGTFVADGSIFSYDGTHTHINATTGEPDWGATGSDYSAMISSLQTYQLLGQGAFLSDNTIGGANLDQGASPKNYLLAGGGRVIPLPASIAKRMQAQYYDLNYLRMFKLNLQMSAEGLPVDQKCGKGWTPDDQVHLQSLLNTGSYKDEAGNTFKTICGEKQPCDPVNDTLNNPNSCDGINPLMKYDGANGDLIAPSNFTAATGLDSNKDFNPVYIYYVAPDKDSFLFSKSGAINISGR